LGAFDFRAIEYVVRHLGAERYS